MTSPLLIHAGAPSTTATSWVGLNYNWAMSPNTGAEANVATVASSSITISNMFVRLTTASGVSGSYTYTLMKNGVATALAVTLNNVTTNSDTIDTVSYSAGDTWTVQVTISGTVVSSGVIAVFLEVNGIQQLVTGNAVVVGTGVSSYLGLQATTQVTSNAGFGSIIPTAGTINNAFLHLTTAPGAAKTYTITLVKNGVDSALTTSVTGAGVTDNSDTTHSVAVAAGDSVYWRIDPSGTPAASRVYITAGFTPTTDGESIQTFTNSTASATTTGNQFAGVGGGSVSYSTTAAIRNNQYGTAFDIKNLYASLSTAPGVGTSYTLTMYQGGVTTALTVPITDSATTGNDTTHTLTGLAVPLAIGPNILASVTPPTASQLSWGYVSYRVPAGATTAPQLPMLGIG